MELVVALGAGVLVIVVSIAALAVWRIGQVTSWRALAMTARATGSFEACVALIRFCAEENAAGSRSLVRQVPSSPAPPRPEGTRYPIPSEWGEESPIEVRDPEPLSLRKGARGKRGVGVRVVRGAGVRAVH